MRCSVVRERPLTCGAGGVAEVGHSLVTSPVRISFSRPSQRRDPTASRVLSRVRAGLLGGT